MAMTIQSIPVAIATPSYQIETITPEYAERVLADNNIGNRPYRRSKVLELVHIIRSGQWIPTSNDAICFAPDGTLINGQHRLMAIVASLCTVQSLVGRNIPHEAYRGMDRGTQRSYADTVYAMGIENHNDVAAAARFVINNARGFGIGDLSVDKVYSSNGGNGRPVTIYEIETFVKHHPFIQEAVELAGKCKKIVRNRSLSSWIFAQHYKRNDMDAVARFIEAMNVLDGNIEQDTCSAVVIGRQLIRYKAERRKIDDSSLFVSLDIAFNEFVKGTSRLKGYVLSKGAK